MIKKILLIVFVLFCTTQLSKAQTMDGNNHFFKAGEALGYDLYFKCGIITSKAGEATLTAVDTLFNNIEAYRLSMTANSKGMARSFFSMDDTLSSIVSKRMLPLQYNKDAHEGKEYTKELITYKYHTNSDSVDIRSWRSRKGTVRFDENFKATGKIYDLISIVYYARSLDYDSMKEGDHKTVEFISGNKMIYMVIEHKGSEKIKANNKKKYDCICLSLSLTNVNKLAFDADEKEEAMRVYITKDKNRMPVRMDFKLKVGSTRAMLREASSLLHPELYLN